MLFYIGDVIYVNQTNATNLAYVSSSDTAIIKVDNTSFVPYNDKRNSVRITTQYYFGVGTVWVIDAVHLPFGCSVRLSFLPSSRLLFPLRFPSDDCQFSRIFLWQVWPSIWTKGNDWPDNGEIDIIEAVNLMTYNQMALHTQNGCMAATGTDETGTSGGNNCSTPSGCTVVRGDI